MMKLKSAMLAVAVAALPFALSSCSKNEQAAAPAGPYAYEQNFGEQSEITPRNVAQLGLAWFHEFDTDRGQYSLPVMADGVLYTSTAWSKVYAFDAKTGKLLWEHDPQVAHETMATSCCDAINRGVAVDQGRVYASTFDGRLLALDGKTGELLWSAQTFDIKQPYTITGAPRVAGNRVIIGNGGAEFGVRGYITAYDTTTGQKAWRFYTVPNAKGEADNEISDKVLAEKAAATWHDGGWQITGGGGTVWEGMAYDPQSGLFYFGVGNGNPHNYRHRSDSKGDNLFLTSIIAVKADTGEYVWHYQQNPGETWDYTATQAMTLADITIDGQVRKVIMQAPKNGFFYVLDRLTGELISAEPFVKVNWATGIDKTTGRPIEVPEARPAKGGHFDMSPGPLGGHGAQAWSFSPHTGLVYIPAQQMIHRYADGEWEYQPGHYNIGYDLSSAAAATPETLAEARKAMWGELVAWDPVAQKARWRVKHPWFLNGGTHATAGGLVFQGTSEGKFHAYDARDGALLWSYEVGTGIMAAPVSYEMDGVQHLALMAGYGGPSAFVGGLTPMQPRRPGRLLVFRLGGDAVAPAYPAEMRAPPFDASVTSDGDVKAGGLVYAANCVPCHGPAALSRFQADLLRSPFMASREGLLGVLGKGSEVHRGMPAFGDILSVTDIENIRAYVIDRARQEKP